MSGQGVGSGLDVGSGWGVILVAVLHKTLGGRFFLGWYQRDQTEVKIFVVMGRMMCLQARKLPGYETSFTPRCIENYTVGNSFISNWLNLKLLISEHNHLYKGTVWFQPHFSVSSLNISFYKFKLQFAYFLAQSGTTSKPKRCDFVF